MAAGWTRAKAAAMGPDACTGDTEGALTGSSGWVRTARETRGDEEPAVTGLGTGARCTLAAGAAPTAGLRTEPAGRARRSTSATARVGEADSTGRRERLAASWT